MNKQLNGLYMEGRYSSVPYLWLTIWAYCQDIAVSWSPVEPLETSKGGFAWGWGQLELHCNLSYQFEAENV